MLNEQHRMYPAISKFSNQYVYQGLLKDFAQVAKQRKKIVDHPPFVGEPINLIDLNGTYCVAAKTKENSRFNILSAVVSVQTALKAASENDESVGIITPYAAQAKLMRAMIRDVFGDEETSLTAATVHQFQGSERDIIVFDAVESYPEKKVGWLMSKNDNDAVTRLINVAVTRSRGKFIAVANKLFWERKIEATTNKFRELLRYIENSGNVIGLKKKRLQDYFNSFNRDEYLSVYDSAKDALDSLKEDFNSAKQKIVFSIPDGVLDEAISPVILSLLKEKRKSGVRVIGKSNEYAVLPEGWKVLTRGTDNADFPLIVIDDHIVWYGLLPSRGRFVDKNISIYPAFSVILRIRGTYTAKMISGLSELEFCRDGQTKSRLTEKTAHLELEISKLEGELASMTGPQNIKKQIADLEKESGNIQRKMVLLDTQMKGIQEKQRVNNLRITDLLRDGKRTEYYRVFKEHQKFEILDELMKEE